MGSCWPIDQAKSQIESSPTPSTAWLWSHLSHHRWFVVPLPARDTLFLPLLWYLHLLLFVLSFCLVLLSCPSSFYCPSQCQLQVLTSRSLLTTVLTSGEYLKKDILPIASYSIPLYEMTYYSWLGFWCISDCPNYLIANQWFDLLLFIFWNFGQWFSPIDSHDVLCVSSPMLGRWFYRGCESPCYGNCACHPFSFRSHYRRRRVLVSEL